MINKIIDDGRLLVMSVTALDSRAGIAMVRLQWSPIRRTGRNAGSALGDRGGPARQPGRRQAEALRLASGRR